MNNLLSFNLKVCRIIVFLKYFLAFNPKLMLDNIVEKQTEQKATEYHTPIPTPLSFLQYIPKRSTSVLK